MHLLMVPKKASFIAGHAGRYARAVMEKTQALDSVIGFIDGTVIGAAKLGDDEQQRVAYNNHKKKQALKY